MGSVISDLFDAVNNNHGDKYMLRKQLNQQHDDIIAIGANEKQKTGKTPYWVQVKREKIGKELSKVRAQITALPVRASKYQTVMKEGMLPWFLQRAARMGWKPNKRPDSQELAKFKRGQYDRQRKRGASTDVQLITMVDKTQYRKDEALSSSADFFDEAAKGWCHLDREDWRADYGAV